MKLARLNTAFEVVGIVDVPPEEWVETDTGIPVPDNCDLEPGRARWDRNLKMFHVRPPAGTAPPAPTFETRTIAAIALGLLSLRKGGQAFPALTQAWLDDWAGSIDAAGLVDRKGDPL